MTSARSAGQMRLTQREVVQDATLVVDVFVDDTPLSRVLWGIGYGLLRVAVWFMGFAGVEVNDAAIEREAS